MQNDAHTELDRVDWAHCWCCCWTCAHSRSHQTNERNIFRIKNNDRSLISLNCVLLFDFGCISFLNLFHSLTVCVCMCQLSDSFHHRNYDYVHSFRYVSSQVLSTTFGRFTFCAKAKKKEKDRIETKSKNKNPRDRNQSPSIFERQEWPISLFIASNRFNSFQKWWIVLCHIHGLRSLNVGSERRPVATHNTNAHTGTTIFGAMLCIGAKHRSMTIGRDVANYE